MRSVRLVVITVFVGLVVGAFAATSQYLLALWGLIILPVVALLILYRSWKHPSFGLTLLVVGVPIQELVFARLFIWGVPANLLAPARYWKEAIASVLVMSALKRKEKPDVVDRMAFVYLGLIALYLALPFGPAINLRLLGARQIGSFLIVFFAARYVKLDEDGFKQIERAILVMGLGMAALAYWNYFNPDGWTNWIESTHILDYRQAVLGTVRAGGGFAVTYGTFGGDQVVRAGSLLLNPLTLPYYLAVPVTISLSKAIRGGANWLTLVVGITCSGAILLTFTRSAILLMPVIGVVAFLAVRNRVRLLVAVILGVLVLAPVVAGTDFGGRVTTAFDPEDPSRQLHESRAGASVDRIWEFPMGTGLSSSAGSDFRFDAGGRIITEDWYLQVGLDLGILGMVLVVFIIVVALWKLWLNARAGSVVGLAALSALLWAALGALVLQHLSDHAVAWSIWLLVGLALRRQEIPSTTEPVEMSLTDTDRLAGTLRYSG